MKLKHLSLITLFFYLFTTLAFSGENYSAFSSSSQISSQLLPQVGDQLQEALGVHTHSLTASSELEVQLSQYSAISLFTFVGFLRSLFSRSSLALYLIVIGFFLVLFVACNDSDTYREEMTFSEKRELDEKHRLIQRQRESLVERYQSTYPLISDQIQNTSLYRADSILNKLGVPWALLGVNSPAYYDIKRLPKGEPGYREPGLQRGVIDTIVFNHHLEADTLELKAIDYHEYFHGTQLYGIGFGMRALEEGIATLLEMKLLLSDYDIKTTYDNLPYLYGEVYGYTTKAQLFLSVIGIENWYLAKHNKGDYFFIFDTLETILGAEDALTMLQYLLLEPEAMLESGNRVMLPKEDHLKQNLHLLAFLTKKEIRQKVTSYWQRQDEEKQFIHYMQFWGGKDFYAPFEIAYSGYSNFRFSRDLFDDSVYFWWNEESELIGTVKQKGSLFEVYYIPKGTALRYSGRERIYEYALQYSFAEPGRLHDTIQFNPSDLVPYGYINPDDMVVTLQKFIQAESQKVEAFDDRSFYFMERYWSKMGDLYWQNYQSTSKEVFRLKAEEAKQIANEHAQGKRHFQEEELSMEGSTNNLFGSWALSSFRIMFFFSFFVPVFAYSQNRLETYSRYEQFVKRLFKFFEGIDYKVFRISSDTRGRSQEKEQLPVKRTSTFLLTSPLAVPFLKAS